MTRDMFNLRVKHRDADIRYASERHLGAILKGTWYGETHGHWPYGVPLRFAKEITPFKLTALNYVHKLDSLASIAGQILILVLCLQCIQVHYVRSSSFVC